MNWILLVIGLLIMLAGWATDRYLKKWDPFGWLFYVSGVFAVFYSLLEGIL